MKKAGFIIKDGKAARHVGPVKWSGWFMTPRQCLRPRERWHALVSLFHGEYHWERKQILRSFHSEFEDFYKKNDRIISFYYELFFGHELRRADSLDNFQNGGVSCSTLINTGKLKGWKVERMVAPTDTIVDNFIYESPFFTEWKRADAKKFSLKRKQVYRDSIPASTELVEYVNPRIEMSRTKTPELGYLARVISDSVELKLLVNYGMTTGKFTFGLQGQDLIKALTYCSRARNPFEAYATGGYSVKTVWRCPPIPSGEWLYLLEHLSTSIDLLQKSIYPRLDVYEDIETVHLRAVNESTKRKRETTSSDSEEEETFGIRGETRGPLVTVSMMDMVSTLPDVVEDRCVIQPAIGLLDDLRKRQINDHFLDVSEGGEPESDLDIFLEEFHEEDEELLL
jgi:hypothetical protein